MGRIVYKQIKGIVIPSGDASVDIWSVLAPADRKIKLLGFQLTSAVTTATIMDVDLRKINAVGSGGTLAGDEEPADDDLGAPGATVRTLDTVPGTGIGGLMAWQWEQLGPIGHVFTPEMAPKVFEGNGFALTNNTSLASAATVSGFICWEEL